MMGALTSFDQVRLIEAMRTIESLLGDRPEPATPYLLRPHRPGDMGWVVHRHGVLYAQEYGWDERFEALVAEIVAKFIRHYDPKVERCWIAEREGQNVGSVFLVKQTKRWRSSASCWSSRPPAGWGSAPVWSRSAPGSPAGRIPENRPLDELRPPRRPEDLRRGRLSPRPRGTASQLRP